MTHPAALKSYAEFLAAKNPAPRMLGIEPGAMPPHLFGHQSACTEFLLRCGSGGLFLDTGLGKTACELEWARQAAAASNGKALILTPLAVARQFEAEGRRWGYDVRVIREQSDAGEGINICNYDRLDRIDVDFFGAVSLDESSILKSFTGKTTRALIASFQHHRFRLSATATPAPNDHMELGNHAEFCGVMTSKEMLSKFFINDTYTASQEWRLKRHGVEAFWDWIASWSRMAQMPSDLGFSDRGFDLPMLSVITHHVEDAVGQAAGGGLFGDAIVSATSMHQIKRQTAEQRALLAAGLVLGETGEQWVIWCDTDYEADAILAALSGAPNVREVRGSHTVERKEDALAGFLDGSVRVLITKPSVTGFGLNWQHCARTVFAGRSFSYESWYQAIRRFWRFGQQRAVECHVIVAQGEQAIGRVIDRKAADHASMKAAMAKAMRRSTERSAATKVAYHPTHTGRLPGWM
jgi:hypothetical protein